MPDREEHPVTQVRRGAALALAAVCTTVLTATAAYAEEVVVNDGADATASLTDIRKVRVDHGDSELSVRVNFPDLRKQADAGLNLYIDKSRRRGPEFGLGMPLFSGSDYALVRMRRWQPVADGLVECDYDVRLRWKKDVMVFTADRGCFGDPDELRVGMRMTDTADQSHPVVDWMIGRREFTSRLSAG